MRLLRQTCSRCDTPILFNKIDKDKGVYKCTTCDSIGSIYEDRVYTTPKELAQLKSFEHFIMGDALLINLKGDQSLPIRGWVGIFLLILILLALFSMIAGSSCQMNGKPLISPWITILLWVLVFCTFLAVRFFILNKRKIQFNIDAHSLEVYQLIDGERISPNEFSIESFMIDQVYVKEKLYPKRTDNRNSRKQKIYQLYIAGKDHEQHSVYSSIGNKEVLMQVATMIEAFLGIKNRQISNEEL